MLQCPSPTKVNPVSWMPRLIIVVCELQSTVHRIPPLPPSIPPSAVLGRGSTPCICWLQEFCTAALRCSKSVLQSGKCSDAFGDQPFAAGKVKEALVTPHTLRVGSLTSQVGRQSSSGERSRRGCRTCWRLRSPLVQVLVLVPVLVLVSAVPVQG